jgi:D-alanyl-D-alanine carboxypeptidase
MPDGSAWSGAVGSATADVPLTTGDALPWASAGKPAVAATLLRLLESSAGTEPSGGTATHRITLSTPAATVIPGLHTAPGATLADLLAHRAGLSEPFDDPVILRGLVDNPWALWRPTTVLADARVVAKRGTFIYSNADYIAAGILISRLTHEPWPAVVRRLVFAPAGSKAWAPAFESGCGPVGHSFSVVAGAAPRDLTGASGMPPFPAILSAMGAAGGFVGTALDLARMGHQIATSRDLVPLFVVRTHSTPVEGPYGMGISRSRVLGLPAVGHGGRLAGTRTVWRCVLANGPCVAVLANRTGIEVEPIAEALLKVVIGQ